MSYGQLATTGTGALMLGGLAINQLGLLAAAVAIVSVGAFALRKGWRVGKAVNSR